MVLAMSMITATRLFKLTSILSIAYFQIVNGMYWRSSTRHLHYFIIVVYQQQMTRCSFKIFRAPQI